MQRKPRWNRGLIQLERCQAGRDDFQIVLLCNRMMLVPYGGNADCYNIVKFPTGPILQSG